MYITWLGQSAFKMQDKIGPDGVTVATDPFDPKYTGLKWSPFEADITTVSHNHKDHNYVKGIRKDTFLVDTPGEFEYKGIFVEGVDSYHDDKEGKERGGNVIYRIEMDDLSITHLGDLGMVLNAKQLEKLEGTDILMIPVGGKYTLDAAKAAEVCEQIDPRIIIPMHYKIDGLKIDIDSAEKFIKKIGLKPETENKLKISKRDLPVDDTRLVLLQP